MGELINLADHRYPWKEIYSMDSDASTVQVHANRSTGEIDIVQMNDDDKVIRSTLSRTDVTNLVRALVGTLAQTKV
jgi:hypothetical protein